jgi:hypothetical protein
MKSFIYLPLLSLHDDKAIAASLLPVISFHVISMIHVLKLARTTVQLPSMHIYLAKPTKIIIRE